MKKRKITDHKNFLIVYNENHLQKGAMNNLKDGFINVYDVTKDLISSEFLYAFYKTDYSIIFKYRYKSKILRYAS